MIESPSIRLVDLLAAIIRGAVERGAMLPALGDLRCLPDGNGLMPLKGNINVELLQDNPRSDDIDENTEAIAGIISTRTKPGKWGLKSQGRVFLWGLEQKGRWFWIRYDYCLECNEDETLPVVVNFVAKYSSIQELVAMGAQPKEIFDTFYRQLLRWHRLSKVMEEAWEEADLAMTEDLDG